MYIIDKIFNRKIQKFISKTQDNINNPNNVNFVNGKLFFKTKEELKNISKCINNI